MRIFNPSRDLLAVNVCVSGIRAGVVYVEDQRVVVDAVAESRAVSLDEALPELVATLQGQIGKLPRKAILLSCEVTPACLDLPVDPQQSLAPEKMANLVRWEIEPLLAQAVATSRLETILVARGYLAAEDCGQVAKELELQRGALEGGEASSLPSFGEVALKLDLITKAHLDECVSIQQASRDVGNEETVCAWSRIAVPSQNGKFSWLSCGLPRRRRDDWSKTFKQHGFRLTHFYPAASCAAAALDEESVGGTVTVLELLPGLIGCTYLTDGMVDGIRLHPLMRQPVTADLCLNLIGIDSSVVWLSGEGADLGQLASEIEERSKRQAEVVPVAAHAEVPEAVAPAALGGMVGASCHAFGLAGAKRAVAIPLRRISMPRFHRHWRWAALGLAATIFVLGAVEISLAWSLKQAEQTYIEASQAYERERLAGPNREYRRAKELETKKNQVLKDLREKGSELFRRRQSLVRILAHDALVPALLDAVSSTTPACVMIRRIEEKGKTIRLEGWALEDEAVQDFANDMSSALQEHGLRVDKVSVRAQTGLGHLDGLEGYGFHLSLLLDPKASMSGQ